MAVRCCAGCVLTQLHAHTQLLWKNKAPQPWLSTTLAPAGLEACFGSAPPSAKQKLSSGIVSLRPGCALMTIWRPPPRCCTPYQDWLHPQRQASALSMIKASHLGPQLSELQSEAFSRTLDTANSASARCKLPLVRGPALPTLREIHNFHNPHFDPRRPAHHNNTANARTDAILSAVCTQ